MDAFGQAREGEQRGKGIPLTDEERKERHYSQYGTTTLPTRGTGLKSIGTLQQLSNDPLSVPVPEIAGLIAGGCTGLFLANKYPSTAVKYIGLIVGAEIGIYIAQLIKNSND